MAGLRGTRGRSGRRCDGDAFWQSKMLKRAANSAMHRRKPPDSYRWKKIDLRLDPAHSEFGTFTVSSKSKGKLKLTDSWDAGLGMNFDQRGFDVCPAEAACATCHWSHFSPPYIFEAVATKYSVSRPLLPPAGVYMCTVLRLDVTHSSYPPSWIDPSGRARPGEIQRSVVFHTEIDTGGAKRRIT